ncbi:MAG: hypothetical protein GX772_14350 [Alcaligenaceae bacterium]|nr:hypothetical protein [Alcaligenaceae bacterium]
MRERLDCAVLLTRCTIDWVEPFLGQYAGGRLYLHAFDIVVDIHSENAPSVLGASAMALRRYDVCVLPVLPATLSWARTSLSQGLRRLHTPVMALARELTTTGLNDLYEFGIADFLRDPFCGHEARIRIERVLDGQRAQVKVAHHVADIVSESPPYMNDPLLDEVCQNILQHDGPELEAYAIAAASRCATSKESFQEAKRKVVERFERAYITAALGRHGGNIAMAARAAQKHRRAFWALMRKHDIDAEPFRARAAALKNQCPASPQATKPHALPRHQGALLTPPRMPGNWSSPLLGGGG